MRSGKHFWLSNVVKKIICLFLVLCLWWLAISNRKVVHVHDIVKSKLKKGYLLKGGFLVKFSLKTRKYPETTFVLIKNFDCECVDQQTRTLTRYQVCHVTYQVKISSQFVVGQPITKQDSESRFLIGRPPANSWRTFKVMWQFWSLARILLGFLRKSTE